MGFYEVRKGASLIRGKVTCFLKPVNDGLEVRGIFDEDLRDHEWHGQLHEVKVTV
jgi:hypothetical protein